MSSNSWNQTLITAQTAGAALTAAATTSMLPTAAKFTLPANTLKIGDIITLRAWGIISNVITTPGSATWALLFGATTVASTGVLPLNTVAKTNVPWKLEIDLTVRAVGGGTSANVWAQGTMASEAMVGAALPGTNNAGSQLLNVPTGSLAVSSGFDSTSAQVIDFQFTQTVATGSMTLQGYELIYKT